jgi:hypothetical protein
VQHGICWTLMSSVPHQGSAPPFLNACDTSFNPQDTRGRWVVSPVTDWESEALKSQRVCPGSAWDTFFCSNCPCCNDVTHTPCA